MRSVNSRADIERTRSSKSSWRTRRTPARRRRRSRCSRLTIHGTVVPRRSASGWVRKVTTVGSASCSEASSESSWSSRWWPRCTPSKTPTIVAERRSIAPLPWRAVRSSPFRLSRPSRMRTAGSGRSGVRPGEAALHVLEEGLDAQLLDRGQAIDEQDAAQVVDLVLDDAGEEVVGTHLALLAAEIAVDDRDPPGAFDLGVEARE